jgi:hypothetical protein
VFVGEKQLQVGVVGEVDQGPYQLLVPDNIGREHPHEAEHVPKVEQVCPFLKPLANQVYVFPYDEHVAPAVKVASGVHFVGQVALGLSTTRNLRGNYAI